MISLRPDHLENCTMRRRNDAEWTAVYLTNLTSAFSLLKFLAAVLHRRVPICPSQRLTLRKRWIDVTGIFVHTLSLTKRALDMPLMRWTLPKCGYHRKWPTSCRRVAAAWQLIVSKSRAKQNRGVVHAYLGSLAVSRGRADRSLRTERVGLPGIRIIPRSIVKTAINLLLPGASPRAIARTS